MKRTMLTAGVILLATLAAIIGVGELGLRLVGFSAPIWHQPDAQLGWTLRPGASGWYTKEGHAYAQISPAGFRDLPHSLEKPQGTFRIAVIGDSVVEAFQIDMKAAFWWHLQDDMRACPGVGGRAVEVMAFGVSGYGTAQEALLLESTAIRYQPDVVLVAFAANDLRNNSKHLEPEADRPFFVAEGDNLRLDTSFTRRATFQRRSSPLYERYRAASDGMRLVQLAQAARHGFETWREAGAAHARTAGAPKEVPGIEPTTNTAMFAAPRDAVWESAWAVTERLVIGMSRFAARHDARFAIAVVSHSAQVHPDAKTRKNLEDALGLEDLFYVERRLETLGSREGIHVIALAPELQKRAEASDVYFHGFPNYRMGWGHWNERGHRSAAEIIAQRLCAKLVER
jgi:lysophospholipase L1-like esterase